MKLLDTSKVPIHVAIIPDGNRRWAKKHSRSSEEGHLAGIEAIVKIVPAAKDLGIKVLTLFGFSTENWQRSKKEVEHLMGLMRQYLLHYKQKILDERVRVRVIGNLQGIPEPLLELLDGIMKETQEYHLLELVLAINYGGRDELVRAMKKISRDILARVLVPDDLDEKTLSSYLDTHTLPDLDLLIRTGGEKRISNFLLWQSSYAEVYIDDVAWPDFTPQHLLRACIDFQQRERRKGGK